MYAIMVQIDIKPEHREAFIAAACGHAQRARQNEPGTVRFDVIGDSANPNRIFLYEAYADEDAFRAHGQAASIAQFRAQTQGWAEATNLFARGTTIHPPDDAPDWNR
jgi:autoinducer 2-degrading protein